MTTAQYWRRAVGWTSRHPRLALLLFLLTFASLGVWASLRSDANPVNSDLFALVAGSDEDAIRGAGLARMRHLSERQQTWIVSHPDMEVAYATAADLAERLTASGLFASVGGPGNASVASDVISFYSSYPYQLADDAALEMGREEHTPALVRRVERALYSGTLALPGLDMEQDPFLLTSHFLNDLLYVPAPFVLDRGMLAAHLEGAWVYLVPTRIARSAFDFDYQRALETFAASVIPNIESVSGASVASIGAVDYATANRNVALREASLISGASVVLIILLVLTVFRSVRPFLAVSFTVVSAVAGGFLICLVSFESVHVLTLVGGSSLIGISVDYAFHLLADGFREEGQPWSVAVGLQAVTPTLALGLLTTLAGFLGLYVSGFRGLQEIAVFSAGGLVIAFVGLILVYPWLLWRWCPGRPPAVLRGAWAWSRLWRPGRRTMLVIAVGAAALMLTMPRFETNSDIRLLSARNPTIDELQQRSEALAGSLLDSRFIVVEAPTVEALLRREETLRVTLTRLRDEGTIAHFNQLSQLVPSQQRQAQTLALNRSLFLGEEAAVEQLRARLGLADRVVQHHRAALRETVDFQPLELENLLDSPLAPMASHLWLGKTGDGVASVVSLGGVHDVGRWSAALEDLEGVHPVDTVADISTLFGLYVTNAVRGLAIAVTLMSLLMITRFGLVEGTALVLVPLLSATLSMLCIGLLNDPINLFHIVGVALILGTGMDYALFLRSGRGGPEAVLAVLLAAVTTECAFGFLGLSQVGAIHSFGLTVALGTAFSFLLAPAVVRYAPAEAAEPA